MGRRSERSRPSRVQRSTTIAPTVSNGNSGDLWRSRYPACIEGSVAPFHVVEPCSSITCRPQVRDFLAVHVPRSDTHRTYSILRGWSSVLSIVESALSMFLTGYL